MRTKSIFIQSVKAYICILLTILSFGLCSGQEVSERVYSPGGSHPLESIFPASDGGAWLLLENAEVLKLNENLGVEWFEIYDLLDFDHLIALAETDEGGVIAGGYEGVISIIVTPTPTPLLTRLSPSGEVIWAKSFDLGYLAYVQSIIKLDDGQFLAVCNSHSGRSAFLYFDEEGDSFNIVEPQINGSGVQTFNCLHLSGERFLAAGDYYDEGLEQRVFYLAEFDGQTPVWSKTYSYEVGASPGNGLYITATSNGDIGFGSRISDSQTQLLGDFVLFRLNETGELIWGKRMELNNDSDWGNLTGLVSNGDDGICHSLTYLSEDMERVSHFTGWDEDGENLFTETVSKTNLEQFFAYEYYRDDGLFVLSSNFEEFASGDNTAVLTLQGPQGQMPCDQSAETIVIEELLPGVTDVSINIIPASGTSTDLETTRQSSNVASYVLCSSILSTRNLEAERRINIYPNPTNNTVFFDLSEVEHETTLIQIFDELGREVFRQNGVSANLFSIQKESIGSGFFIARISNSDTGEMVKEGKFVVK